MKYLFSLLLTSFMFGQGYLEPIPAKPAKSDYSTRYVLIWRAAEQNYYSAGNDAIGTRITWTDHVEAYKSLDDVLAELNRTPYVKEASGPYEREVVGVYSLQPALSELKFSEGRIILNNCYDCAPDVANPDGIESDPGNPLFEQQMAELRWKSLWEFHPFKSDRLMRQCSQLQKRDWFWMSELNACLGAKPQVGHCKK